MNVRNKLNDFRYNVKEQICNMLTDIYKYQHNGQLPNWENDEDIVVEDNECHINIMVMEGNTYDEDVCPVWYCIDKFIVTLDYNLILISKEDDMEFEWTELGTDELVRVEDCVSKYFFKFYDK